VFEKFYDGFYIRLTKSSYTFCVYRISFKCDKLCLSVLTCRFVSPKKKVVSVAQLYCEIQRKYMRV